MGKYYVIRIGGWDGQFYNRDEDGRIVLHGSPASAKRFDTPEAARAESLTTVADALVMQVITGEADR